MALNMAESQKYDRALRIKTLLSALQACQEANREAERERIIAVYSLEFGVSRRTMLEYLGVLEMAGKIKTSTGLNGDTILEMA